MLYAMLCYDMLRYVMLCYGMQCYAVPCYAMQCYRVKENRNTLVPSAMSCCVKLYSATAAQPSHHAKASPASQANRYMSWILVITENMTYNITKHNNI